MTLSILKKKLETWQEIWKERFGMSNKINKPMMTSESLIAKMRDEKGITFKYINEEKAQVYLTDINNYLRTAAYRRNYPKYTCGVNRGKYIKLDFAYLQEMSTIEMHFRFLVNRMCLDIEQALKVKLVKDVLNDANADAYKIVEDFLTENYNIVKSLESRIMSPFTGDLIQKYFDVQREYNSSNGRHEHRIKAYNDCPIWVLCEVLTFGEFLRLYDFYYGDTATISMAVLALVRNMRNGSAHNNCMLANLSHGTSRPPREIRDYVKKMGGISTSQRRKKLSCRPMLEFVSLIYTYELVVTTKVKLHRSEELYMLFFERVAEKKPFFKDNDLIRTNYEFAGKVIHESLCKQK